MNKPEIIKGATKEGELARFETLKYLQEGLSVTEISKVRKINRSSVYKVLATLSKHAMITFTGRGNYQLTDKGINGLHSFVQLKYKLRQHNLHFKIEVLESPRNWALKRNEIRTLPYFNKSLKLKNNEQDLFNMGKIAVRTTTKSVIVKMPHIYATDWEDCMVQSISILEDVIIKIENAWKIKLRKDYKANIKIISQEYAKIQDAIAKLYRCEGNRVYLSGEDGKIWLITDFSFSTDELEFIHPEKATDDVDAIAPFFNDLRKNPITISQIREETKGVLEAAKSEMQNVVKHQRVLDEILLAFKKINDRLDKAGL